MFNLGFLPPQEIWPCLICKRDSVISLTFCCFRAAPLKRNHLSVWICQYIVAWTVKNATVIHLAAVSRSNKRHLWRLQSRLTALYGPSRADGCKTVEPACLCKPDESSFCGRIHSLTGYRYEAQLRRHVDDSTPSCNDRSSIRPRTSNLLHNVRRRWKQVEPHSRILITCQIVNESKIRWETEKKQVNNI